MSKSQECIHTIFIFSGSENCCLQPPAESCADAILYVESLSMTNIFLASFRLTRWRAIILPTTPPPMMTTSYLDSSNDGDIKEDWRWWRVFFVLQWSNENWDFTWRPAVRVEKELEKESLTIPGVFDDSLITVLAEEAPILVERPLWRKVIAVRVPGLILLVHCFFDNWPRNMQAKKKR